MKVTEAVYKVSKEEIFNKSSRILSAMASPVRLRIVQLLSNGPKSVEEIAETLNQKVGNTSQHLQKMSVENIVSSRKQGTKRIYQVSNQKLLKLWIELQNLSETINSDIKNQKDLICPPDLSSKKPFTHIIKEVKEGRSDLIDVRPEDEFQYGSSKYALSIPAGDLKKEMKKLTKDKTYYLMCRGRFCPLANKAVIDMRKAGFNTFRLEFSYYEMDKR